MFNADTTFFDNQDFILSAPNLTGKSFHQNHVIDTKHHFIFIFFHSCRWS